MKKLFVIASSVLCFSCSKEYKYELKEDLTYLDYVDESLVKNEGVNSIFKTISEDMESLTENGIELLRNGVLVEYKSTQDETETVGEAWSNLFSSGADLVSMTSDAIGLEVSYNSVIEQVRKLHSLNESFNSEKAELLSRNFKDYISNVYSMKYTLMKENYLSLNLDKKTIEAWKSNPKLDPYYTKELVPTYFDMITNYVALRRTLALNKISQPQLDELIIQLQSNKDEGIVFKESRSISNFKNSYSKFIELADLKNPAIASEVEFLNESSNKVLENSINTLKSNSDDLFKMLGQDNTANFKSIISSFVKNNSLKELHKLIRKL